MSHRPMTAQGQPGKPGGWHDDQDEAADASFKALSREEAAALREKEPPVSPWRVVMAQAVIGVIAALLGGLLTGRSEVAWSLLYGAAVVVMPGALMARGMTSRLSSVAPGTSAVSFMVWELVKIGVSVVMLVVANRIVQPLVWPALLVGLVVCIKVYWVALLWRRKK
jgi:ATP synthase protein I